MQKIITIIFLLFFSFTNLTSEEEEIFIYLNTQSRLTPIYIDNTHAVETNLSRDYVAKLEEVLHFNFQYNGRTKVIHQKHLANQEVKISKTAEDWHALGIDYVFKLSLNDNYLTLSVLSTFDDEIYFAEEIKITNDYSKDRRALHALSQHVHRKLFNEEGIYQSKILYTLKSPSGGSVNQSTWISEIFECDWDGENTRQITREGNYCVTPSYLPDEKAFPGGGFFYVSYKIGQPKIYWASLKEGVGKRFTYIRGNQLMPEISPKGDTVVFISDAPGNPEVFLQDFKPKIGAVGKPRQVFSCKRAVQASPTFSPDGERIAFVSDKDGTPRIYVIRVPSFNTQGREVKPILVSKQNSGNTKPTWSPDGTKLAYSARTNGVRQIWIYDFNTQKESQLTFGPGDKENPHFAFNSLHLVFNSVGHASCELYLVNLNQPEVIRIKPSTGMKRFPVWSPKK